MCNSNELEQHDVPIMVLPENTAHSNAALQIATKEYKYYTARITIKYDDAKCNMIYYTVHTVQHK